MLGTALVLLALADSPTHMELRKHLSPREVQQYTFGDHITSVHEQTHIVHHNGSKHGVNQALLFDNKLYTYPWPKKTKLSHVQKRVPLSLRGHRYQTYLVSQVPDRWETINGQAMYVRGREENPLYLLDEYLSYNQGAKAGLEEASQGIYPPRQTDLFIAPLEMMVYAKALVKTLQEQEPEYLKANPTLLPRLEKEFGRSLEYYLKAEKDPKLTWNSNLLRKVMDSGTLK